MAEPADDRPGLVSPFDAGLKHLLERDPDAFLAGLGLANPHPVRVLDSDVATVHMRVDKVLRIEGPDPWLIHVEFQASHDPRLPARLLDYNVFLGHRHRLPVWSVALLLRQEADGRGLLGVERRVLPDGETYHEFRYRVVRLWEQSAEQLLSGGLVTLPLAPLADVTVGELPGVIRRMDDRLTRETTPEEARELWTLTQVLMGLRYPLRVTQRLLRGVTHMKESVTYQAILEEGREAGEAAGRLDGARRILLIQGTERFGPPDPHVRAELDRIDALERLEWYGRRVLHAASWEELLTDS